MQKQRSIISEWLIGKNKQQRSEILDIIGLQSKNERNLPIERTLEQFAAKILSACAADLGLSTLELSGLLNEPRKDALAGLITGVKDGV